MAFSGERLGGFPSAPLKKATQGLFLFQPHDLIVFRTKMIIVLGALVDKDFEDEKDAISRQKRPK